MNQILGNVENDEILEKSLENTVFPKDNLQNNNINNYSNIQTQPNNWNIKSEQQNINNINNTSLNSNFQNQNLVSLNEKNNNSRISEKKIIIIFCTILLLFAIVSITLVLNISQKNKKARNIAQESKKENTKPIININEQDGKLNIEIKHVTNLDKVVYSWNEDQSTEKVYSDLMNSNFILNNIEIPLGENKFDLLVIDEHKVEEKFSKTFINENGNDIEKPNIEFEDITDDNTKSIKINVKDNKELQKVTYAWNDEEEKEVELSDEDKKDVKFKVEIKTGKNNTLKITATDKAGNELIRTRNFDGLLIPEVSFDISEDKTKFIIIFKHPEGVKGISYKFNGQRYSSELTEKTTVGQAIIDLVPGDNLIEDIVATSVDGMESEPKTKNVKLVEKNNQTENQSQEINRNINNN